jgi:hypothetical protein
LGQSKANTAAERRKRVGLVFFLFRRLAQSGAVCWDAGLCEHVSLSRRRRLGGRPNRPSRLGFSPGREQAAQHQLHWQSVEQASNVLSIRPHGRSTVAVNALFSVGITREERAQQSSARSPYYRL